MILEKIVSLKLVFSKILDILFLKLFDNDRWFIFYYWYNLFEYLPSFVCIKLYMTSLIVGLCWKLKLVTINLALRLNLRGQNQ